jgi:hypothetical protein
MCRGGMDAERFRSATRALDVTVPQSILVR